MTKPSKKRTERVVQGVVDRVVIPAEGKLSGVLCEHTVVLLEHAARYVANGTDVKYIMGKMDEAVGHQIMCRYWLFGRHDYDKAIEQVHDLARQMGIDLPEQKPGGAWANDTGKPNGNRSVQ